MRHRPGGDDRTVPPADTIVVVGAGIAGVACARRIAGAGLPVRVLERGRRPGGRMGRRTVHGRTVDLGAQYLTAADASFRALVDGWHARALARPWTDAFHTGDGSTLGGPKPGPTRWAAVGGLGSLVEDLAAGLDVRCGRRVRAVRAGAKGPQVDGEPARAVALAMPDPQAARLLARDDPGLAAPLDHTWSPTLALAAGWVTRRWDLDGVFVHHPADGAGEQTLTWIADDGRRRGDDAAVLVAHSTPELAQAHPGGPDDARAPMLAALRRQLSIADEPTWTQVRRWGLAKPTGTREDRYRLVDRDGLVGVCGDGWSATPKVEAAWKSGDALGATLVERLG